MNKMQPSSSNTLSMFMPVISSILMTTLQPQTPQVDKYPRTNKVKKYYKNIEAKTFDRITHFWKNHDKRELYENQYVRIPGTISKFIPLVAGNPKHKEQTHLQFRRLLPEIERNNQFSVDVTLALTSGNMVWRPPLNLIPGIVPLGLYQCIVRNSIHIFVNNNYFQNTVENIFKRAENSYVVDVEVQGKLITLSDKFESQFRDANFFGQIENIMTDYESNNPIYALIIDGLANDTWIKKIGDSKYLDGDIWIDVEYNGKEIYLSRFLDLADRDSLRKGREDLRRDGDRYPHAKVAHEFDQVETLFS